VTIFYRHSPGAFYHEMKSRPRVTGVFPGKWLAPRMPPWDCMADVTG
jgi:hypothetical protein